MSIERKVSTNSWDTATFGLMDIFNIPLGIVEGALGAIKSKEANFLCSRNTTATRKSLEAMVGRIENNEIKDAVTEFYRAIQRTDDIVINCGNAIISNNDALDVFSSTNGDSYIGETLVTNILYNLGFQFTDVLDLIFIDPSNVEPFWYYVSYRVGDFLIRFIYKDTSA
jgi:hypothetical protein